MQDDPAKRARATNTDVATHRAARLFAKPYQGNLSRWTEQAIALRARHARGDTTVLLELSRLRAEAENSGRSFENARGQLPSEVAQHSLLRDVLRAHEQLLQGLPHP
jgi:hypothetical protein